MSEDDEINEHWNRYYALPWRQKIRQEGVITWLTNTNDGIGAALTVVAAASYLCAKLIGWA